MSLASAQMQGNSLARPDIGVYSGTFINEEIQNKGHSPRQAMNADSGSP